MDYNVNIVICVILCAITIEIIEASIVRECFDTLSTEKCERKRKIGKCKSNPWRMMHVCNKTCYCDDYAILQSGHDCQSNGSHLGIVQSTKECAILCKSTNECLYFMTDKKGNDQHWDCFWKKMNSSSCIEGWNKDKQKNTFELKGPMGVRLLHYCDVSQHEISISGEKLLEGDEIKLKNVSALLYKRESDETSLRHMNKEIKGISSMIDKKLNDSRSLICAEKDDLTKDFQKCFSHDISNAQKFLHSNFRMTNACNFTYFSESKFDNCSMNHDLRLNTTISCRYKGMNEVQIVTWACLLELDTNNQDCKNKDKIGKPNFGKFFFMHTFAIDWASRAAALNSNREILETNNKNTSPAIPVIIGVIVVSCSVLVAIALFISIRCYRRIKRIDNQEEIADSLPNRFHEENNYVDAFNLIKQPSDDIMNFRHESVSIISANECVDCQMVSSLPSDILKLPDMLYPRCSVTIEEGIGFGNFGTVCKGSLRIGNARFPIAIKNPHPMMDGSFNNEEMQMFLEEAKNMLEIGEYHENIVNLQGLVYGKEDIDKGLPKFSLMLEYCPKGNLRSYLIDHEKEFKGSLKSYHDKGSIVEPKKFQETLEHDIKLLCFWACQVANGMQFLSMKHIHHGDLAARNVLLTENLVIKISDFGLSRRLYQDLGESQDVMKKVNENKKIPLRLPMKWLALEVLMHQKIVPSKSDVWSYGVLLWEIFQLGAVPYRNGIDFEQLVLELRFGVRLPPPQFCPFVIADLMKQCFHEDPYQRPSFEKLKNALTQICSAFNTKSSSLENNDLGNENEKAVIYTDMQMKERYFKVKEKNKNLKSKNHMCSNGMRYIKPFALSCTYVNDSTSIDSPVGTNEDSGICLMRQSSYSEPDLNYLKSNHKRKENLKNYLEGIKQRSQNKKFDKYETYHRRNKTKPYVLIT